MFRLRPQIARKSRQKVRNPGRARGLWTQSLNKLLPRRKGQMLEAFTQDRHDALFTKPLYLVETPQRPNAEFDIPENPPQTGINLIEQSKDPVANLAEHEPAEQYEYLLVLGRRKIDTREITTKLNDLTPVSTLEQIRNAIIGNIFNRQTVEVRERPCCPLRDQSSNGKAMSHGDNEIETQWAGRNRQSRREMLSQRTRQPKMIAHEYGFVDLVRGSGYLLFHGTLISHTRRKWI